VENIFKSGFVSIIGRPNVGKSTLLNHFTGQKIAITSGKPQTTRTNIKGIMTFPERGQIVFVDTPGLHKPHHLLGEHLVKRALQSLEGTDVILFLVDGTTEPGGGDRYIVENILASVSKPVFLLINKIDKVGKKDKGKYLEAYQALYPFQKVFSLSARHDKDFSEMLNAIISLLPQGAKFYEEDLVTDENLRDLAGELIREQLFRLLGEEVPHSCAVSVDSFKEKKVLTDIQATIYVERDSQKGIVIGKGGAKLREIGEKSRLEIEKLLEAKVFLALQVKLLKNWRKNIADLQRLGYKTD